MPSLQPRGRMGDLPPEVPGGLLSCTLAGGGPCWAHGCHLSGWVASGFRTLGHLDTPLLASLPSPGSNKRAIKAQNPGSIHYPRPSNWKRRGSPLSPQILDRQVPTEQETAHRCPGAMPARCFGQHHPNPGSPRACGLQQLPPMHPHPRVQRCQRHRINGSQCRSH